MTISFENGNRNWHQSFLLDCFLRIVGHFTPLQPCGLYRVTDLGTVIKRNSSLWEAKEGGLQGQAHPRQFRDLVRNCLKIERERKEGEGKQEKRKEGRGRREERKG